MRLKAVPALIETTAEAHPLLVGAAVVAIGVSAYYYTRTPTQALDADPNASTQYAYTYGMPMVVPGSVGGIATGVVDSITNPAAPGTGVTTPTTGGIADVSNLDIFNFEKLKEEHDYDLASRSLDAQLQIALVNASTAALGIQATNWQTSANLAAQFLRSGQQFFSGSVGGQTFAFLGSGALTPGQGKKSIKYQAQQNAFFMSLLNNSTIQSIIGGSNNVVQSSTGSLPASTLGGATATASGSSGGSSSIAASLSSASASSGQSSTYDTSAYQAASVGTGGGRASGGGFVGSVSY